MSAKRRVSSFAQTDSVSTDAKKTKITKRLIKASTTSRNGADKESDTTTVLSVQTIKNDPTRINSMTVDELKIVLRDAGVPIQGRKVDLLAALKALINKESETCCENTQIVDVRCDDGMNKMGKALDHKLNKAKKDELAVLAQTEPWAILAHKKPQENWVAYNPTTMRLPSVGVDTKCMKIISWNVNGLRAMLKSEGSFVSELVLKESFDVLCLQETKLQEKDVESIKDCLIKGYENCFWTCSRSKLGYSGTAIISRIKPITVTYGLGKPDHDSEGRIVTAEFASFYLVCAYVPNSGDGLKRLSYRTEEWDPSLSHYLKDLEKSKPVILTGDLNCAHQEIDIYNPAGNRRSAGFTDEERQSFTTNFLSKGLVDTFRKQHPHAVGYTYWGYRHGGRKFNRGWRLDYFLLSESLAANVHDSYIVPDVPGSDHCPIGLIVKL